jgi:hypothetical protein
MWRWCMEVGTYVGVVHGRGTRRGEGAQGGGRGGRGHTGGHRDGAQGKG